MESIKNELMLLMKERGYSILDLKVESTDVVSVEIEVDSNFEKIYVYVYDDRFVLTTGFSAFEVLKRNERSKTDECMELEKKIEMLEKKVAALEVQAQKQPKEKADIDKICKQFEKAFIEACAQL